MVATAESRRVIRIAAQRNSHRIGPECSKKRLFGSGRAAAVDVRIFTPEQQVGNLLQKCDTKSEKFRPDFPPLAAAQFGSECDKFWPSLRKYEKSTEEFDCERCSLKLQFFFLGFLVEQHPSNSFRQKIEQPYLPQSFTLTFSLILSSLVAYLEVRDEDILTIRYRCIVHTSAQQGAALFGGRLFGGRHSGGRHG